MAEEQTRNFGKNVRSVRDALNMKQKEFARGLDISIQHLSDIERGKKGTGLDFFAKMLNEYNVNLNYLLLGEGEMFLQGIGKDRVLLDQLADANPDVKQFLNYFIHSGLVHYRVLSDFRKYFNEEEQAIKNDVEKNT